MGNAAATHAVNMCDRPLAADGLTSYRCRGRYGWIMIGGKNDDDALREAQRSCKDAARETLQRWDGQQYVNVSPPPLLGAAAQLHARQCHYDRLHHMKRYHDLRTKPDLDSEQARMLHASRAILNSEVPGTRSVDLSDAAYIAELDEFEIEDRERRRKPYWVPEWKWERQIDNAKSVADAMDRYYKYDRLNREGGTRERLIADREQELAEKGFACVASYHDSVNGQGIYLRAMPEGLTIWSSSHR